MAVVVVWVQALALVVVLVLVLQVPALHTAPSIQVGRCA
jgi:hypothetical protein